MYNIFRITFPGRVHFGDGTLDSGSNFFRADTLFSALCIEALKTGKLEELVKMVDTADLLFSNAFPYSGLQYYLPKPLCQIERSESLNWSDSVEKKKYKALHYIRIDMLDDYLKGNMNFAKNGDGKFGTFDLETKVTVRTERDALPYHVGTYSFKDDCGLYIIVKGKDDTVMNTFRALLTAVSFSGLGGKRSSGMGRFSYSIEAVPDELVKRLENLNGQQMLLCSALPKDNELDTAMANSSYTLCKRSGFVFSDTFSKELLKKQDLYVFDAGSCFNSRFDGDIVDVSGTQGSHPVLRYAKGFFMNLEAV